MNRPLLYVLITLNVLLAAILAVEWATNTEPQPVKTSAQTQNNNAELDEALPELDLTATSEDDYSDLVERPLFIKGRKPVNEPEPETATAAVKKVEAFNWELTGIFTTPKGVTAFLSRTNTKVPKDNYRKPKIGEELDGWKITEINTDNIILTQAGETKILQLRKAKPKSPLKADINKPQQPVAPVSEKPTQQQGALSQTLQIPSAVNNIEPQADESVEAVPE